MLLLFLSSSLYGADIDKRLLEGDKTYYKSLLSKLDNSNPSLNKEDILLQKAIIKKLIYFSSKKAEGELQITIPKNQREYLALFVTYLKWSKNKKELEEKIKNSLNSLAAIRSQISVLKQDDPSLFTLQLQYAFYKKGLEFYRSSLSALKKAMEKTPEILVKALSTIKIDTTGLHQRLKNLDAQLADIRAKIQARHIEIERLTLLGKQDAVKKLRADIEHLKENERALIVQKIKALFLIYSSDLKSKNKAVFEDGAQILKLVSSLKDSSYLEQDLAWLIDKMDTLVLGNARTFRGHSIQKLKLLFGKFKQIINTPLFYVNGVPVSLFKCFLAIFVFTLGFLAGHFYKRNLDRLKIKGHTIPSGTKTLLGNLGYYAFVTIGFFLGLKVLGIDLSSFALVAGALSVGIGFGLQNMVSNLVSGIILMFERSVRIGDYIEFDDKLRGRVVDMRMRSITVCTNSNINVIVPNQDFIQNRVINWTMNDDIRRFDIPFSVSYGTQPNKVAAVIMEALNKSDIKEVYSSAHRKNKVIMLNMGESSIDFCLQVWVKGVAVTRPKRTKSKFLILIYTALYESGIEIPFPQLDVHVRSIKANLPVVLKDIKK